MKNGSQSVEWKEAMRLLHKFVPISAYLKRPEELGINSVYELLEAWDPNALHQGYQVQESKGSGDLFLCFVDGHKFDGERALVIPDAGWIGPEFFPFVCSDTTLVERMNEECKSERLICGSKDTMIVLESGIVVFFDHEKRVKVAQRPK